MNGKDGKKQSAAERGGAQRTEPSRLVGIDTASQLVGLRVSTLYLYAARRRIPHVKLGTRLLFDPAELSEWIDAHRVPALTAKAS